MFSCIGSFRKLFNFIYGTVRSEIMEAKSQSDTFFNRMYKHNENYRWSIIKPYNQLNTKLSWVQEYLFYSNIFCKCDIKHLRNVKSLICDILLHE